MHLPITVNLFLGVSMCAFACPNEQIYALAGQEISRIYNGRVCVHTRLRKGKIE